MYGINSFSGVLANCTCSFIGFHPLYPLILAYDSLANGHILADEFKNDPRNPNAKTPKPADKH
jgi:hypothetical protein